MHNNEFRRFFITLLKIANGILPVLFWISVILSFDELPIAMMTIVCALIHEIGHILILVAVSKNDFSLRGVSSGFRISTSRLKSYKEELALYLSGPAMNVLVCLISLTPLPCSRFFLSTFSALNLATAISNLLPVEGYDGYGALKCILCLFGQEKAAEGILPAISFFSIFVLGICSLYFIDRFGEGYWIFFVFSVSLIKKLDSWLSNSKNGI